MRQDNVKIFNDTLEFINSNNTLKTLGESIFYNEDNMYDGPSLNPNRILNNVFVTKSKTIEAAIRLHKDNPNSKIAILNFASATNPGGGVVNGANAQEESICRLTNLYPSLNTKKNRDKFYNPNKKDANPLHNDNIIYTKDIIICKSDDGKFRRFNDDEFIKIDVITCAAPNLRDNPNNKYNNEGTDTKVNISDDDLYTLHLKRARCILKAAMLEQADILVLGAFGCGAFRNNPYIVAKAYKEAIKDYCFAFKEIEFAIYCRDYETENYDAFVKEFK